MKNKLRKTVLTPDSINSCKKTQTHRPVLHTFSLSQWQTLGMIHSSPGQMDIVSLIEWVFFRRAIHRRQTQQSEQHVGNWGTVCRHREHVRGALVMALCHSSTRLVAMARGGDWLAVLAGGSVQVLGWTERKEE
jgi:hypothetical protein